MGWLDGLFGLKPTEDPVQKLDPKLRDFLEKESPLKFQERKSLKQETPEQPRKEAHPAPPTPHGGEDAQKSLPSATLYRDGRYADLWKTYKPLEAVEADTKSSHEKLMDVLDSYKERKTLIGKAALENCSFQQEEWRRCMLEGSWTDKMRMCSDQVRKFERCYTMQSRFLRVLGYRADPSRTPIQEEDIQLHADSLYQRMIMHEELATKAREAGLPVPKFEILPPPVAAKAPPAPVGEDVEKMWKDQLDKLPEDERAAEEAALRADYFAKATTAEKLRVIKEKEDAERRQRRKEGKATMGDRFWGLVGSGSDEGKGA